MIKIFDPSQESEEEYLRRIHLDNKTNIEWKNDEQKKAQKNKEKINIVGQDFQKADYLYSNFISEVDKNINDKYKIPSNFTTISKFILDDITVYEVFKKNK